MKVNDIITLENEQKFTLLEELIYEEEKYFLAMEHDKNDKIDMNKPRIFKCVEEKDDFFVEFVQDESLIILLSKNFKTKINEQ